MLALHFRIFILTRTKIFWTSWAPACFGPLEIPLTPLRVVYSFVTATSCCKLRLSILFVIYQRFLLWLIYASCLLEKTNFKYLMLEYLTKSTVYRTVLTVNSHINSGSLQAIAWGCQLKVESMNTSFTVLSLFGPARPLIIGSKLYIF